MALSLSDQLLVKQETRLFAKQDAQLALFLKAFWMYQGQYFPGRQFYVEFFANLTGDTVIADAACKVYLIAIKKQNTATDAFFKLTDHATVSAGNAASIMVEQTIGNEWAVLIFPDGNGQGTGVTINSSTTGDGGTTDSTSGDGADGFIVIGAA